MSTIQFIQITPEQLQDEILRGVKVQLNELIKHFQPVKPSEFLTRNEVADLLKVDISTLYNWTKKGILIQYGIGGRVYYKRQEVEEAIIKLK
jgi:excisionase family DNA binding protein